jgi:hypothetical protein
MAEPPVLTSRASPPVVVPLFAVLALVGGRLPSFSPAATLYVLALGGVLTWLGLSGRVSRQPVAPQHGAVWWMLPVAVFLPVEMTNYVLGSTYEHPTISILLDPLVDGELAKSVVYFGWLVAFWALGRR